MRLKKEQILNLMKIKFKIDIGNLKIINSKLKIWNLMKIRFKIKIENFRILNSKFKIQNSKFKI